MHAEPNYPTLGKKAGRKFLCFLYFLFSSKETFLGKVKDVTDKIREMKDADIEKLLLKGENEGPLTVIDDVPIESEDVHIVYRVGQQTRYEAKAEKGVGYHLILSDFGIIRFCIVHSLWFYLIIQLMHH
jgi:hypothetical protein